MRSALIAIFVCGSALSFSQYQFFQIEKAQSLRGVAALSENTCWVSGAGGKVFKTLDGGRHWQDVSPGGFDSLDFRDIELFDEGRALVMSAGYPTRLLKTSNGGRSWEVVYHNDDKRVFLDAMDFWGDGEGMVFGDAIGSKLLVLKTSDQVTSWTMIDSALLPTVAYKQGGFAASGSCLQTFGNDGVIIGLGGHRADLIISRDRGKSWTKMSSPLSAGAASAGIFSFNFLNSFFGLCAGGDYTGNSASQHSLAVTRDGGQSWELITDPAVDGYYHSSCLILNENTMLTMSRFGSSWSHDGGHTWERREESYYSLGGFAGGFWASGEDGKVARWRMKP